MAIIRIPDFNQAQPIVDATGKPLAIFLRALNNAFRQLTTNANDVSAALAAAGIATAAAAAANAAATAANTAATDAQTQTAAQAKENSIVSSFVTNFAGATPVTASSTGTVTIANHDRQYGDPTLDPTVSVTGAAIATGATSGQTVRVYYVQPSRAGGAVTYLFTVDPADPPVQGGDTHSVGAVTIPGAGSSDGGWVRPPGYTGPIP